MLYLKSNLLKYERVGLGELEGVSVTLSGVKIQNITTIIRLADAKLIT